MTVEYVKLVEQERSVLLATLISLGFQEPFFEKSTGWNYGVEYHKYESGEHYVSEEDLGRLRQLITERAESEPDLWSDYVHRCTSKGDQLIETARSLDELNEDAHSPQELVKGFTTFTEATKEMAPFSAATPLVRAELESFLTHRIGEEIGGPNGQEKGGQFLPRLLVSRESSEALQEIRNCYRIALEIAKNDEVLDLFRNKSSATAVSRIEEDFPRIRGLIRHHIDEYGWLRARGSKLDPPSLRELVERIQVVLLRWQTETIRQAAERKPPATVEQLLGFSPSESLARLIGALQDLVSLRSFRIDVHLQAEYLARPFFNKVAEAMGCTREQFVFSSVEEILEALTQQTELPIPEIDNRMRNSFTVERSQDDLRVHSYRTPLRKQEGIQPPAATLTGQSVSRGRATGVVRVIFGPSEIGKVGLGDVLVTEASTTDLAGGETVFPTRTDAALDIQKVAAIVTDEGGLLSHAAIISREHGIPCVVGTERATKALIDGQVVEVDATEPAGRVVAFKSS